MGQPQKKRKYNKEYAAAQPMAIDRPLRKPRYRSSLEKKWFDTTIAATTMDSAGTILSSSINLIDEGNGVSEMAGRKVIITRIQMRATLVNVNDADTIGNLNNTSKYRLIIALDRQCNGASPTVLGLLTSANINSFNNLSQSRRYKIMKDECGVISSEILYNTSTTSPTAATKKQDVYVYLKCWLPIMFSEQQGANRVIGEVISNNLWVMGFSDNSNITVAYTCRVRFQDN